MSTKRRASERPNPFDTVLAPPPVQAPAAAPAVAVPEDDQPDQPTKYTMLFDPELAATFDELALYARRKLRRPVDKSKLIRAMILLASSDPNIREQLLDEVGKRS